MATTGVITVYLKDVAILDEEAERRARELHGADYDIQANKANREEFLRLRKDVLHEIVSRSKYGRKKNK